MAFTNCVDHVVSIQSLIALFLTQTAIFGRVTSLHSSETTPCILQRPDLLCECDGVATRDLNTGVYPQTARLDQVNKLLALFMTELALGRVDQLQPWVSLQL